MSSSGFRKIMGGLALAVLVTATTGVARVSGISDATDAPAEAAHATPPLWRDVPDSISPHWKALISNRGERRVQDLPDPQDAQRWATLQQANDAHKEPRADEVAMALNVTYQEARIGGVPVLDITPARPVSADKIAVYIHGGSYVANSAKALFSPGAIFAAQTGLRVISVDYTLAPHSQWDETTDEILAVFEGLAQQGIAAGDIVLFGDSAGGGLAAGSTLKMRDRGLEMPAALVLWSPWADVTASGDTYITLRDADPSFTFESVLEPAAHAYAAPEDQQHPYVSPIYGDFDAGFPPTLIQGGTREIMLSDMVRLYQAIESGGQVSKLDIYEGMPHNFIPARPGSAESRAAVEKVDQWVQTYLLDS